MELLYIIFLLPIETIMKLVLELAYKLTNNYGVTIILLSIIVNIMLIPIYNMAEKWKEKDKEKRDSMKVMLGKIKQNYHGKERYFYTQALYKIHSYSPISSVKASAGFLIQIPFFFAAFSLLSNYEPLQGLSFWVLQDLSKPDGLLFGINLLPFLMTVMNLFAAYVNTNKYDKNEKYQLWGIALLFLVLLYTQASGLLLYWTFNNIFSFVKNLLNKYKCKIKFKFNFEKYVKHLNLKIEKIKTIYLLQFLAAFTLFFLVPLHIANQSGNGWNDFNRDIFFISALIYFVLFFCLEILFVFFIYFVKLKKIILPITIYILTWIVLAGFVFPIAESNGMVEPDAVLTNSNNLIIVSLASLLILLLGIIKNYKLPIIFNVVIILICIIDISLGSIKHSKTMNENLVQIVKKFETITDNNIIVLSFDGLPSFVFKNVLNNNKEFKEIFKDFTYFTESFSTAPATVDSTKSSLFGNRDFRKEGDRGATVDLSEELNRLPMNILEDSYTYGIYSSFKNNNQNKFPANYYSKNYQNVPFVTNSFYLIHISLSRVFSSLSFKTLQDLKIDSYSKEVVFSILPKSEIDYILKNFKGTSWDMPYTLQKYEFDNIVKNLNVNSDKKSKITLRQMHFIHTHFPVDFDENCMLRSTDKEWFDNNQNYQGLYNQTICVAKQFSSFIEKLKKLGIYDKSLIVLKSDHGEPVNYFNDTPNGYKINNHPLWGYNRYKPLLMIKDFDTQQNVIKEDSSFVGLSDLAKTLCIKSNLENCVDFKGVNLLSENIENEIIQNPYIYVDVVIDESSDFKSETHKTIKIDRSKYSNILEAFKNHSEVNLSLD